MTSSDLTSYIQMVNLTNETFYSIVDIIGQKLLSTWKLPKSSKFLIFLIVVRENIAFEIISAMLEISEVDAKEAFFEVLEAINDLGSHHLL